MVVGLSERNWLSSKNSWTLITSSRTLRPVPYKLFNFQLDTDFLSLIVENFSKSLDPKNPSVNFTFYLKVYLSSFSTAQWTIGSYKKWLGVSSEPTVAPGLSAAATMSAVGWHLHRSGTSTKRMNRELTVSKKKRKFVLNTKYSVVENIRTDKQRWAGCARWQLFSGSCILSIIFYSIDIMDNLGFIDSSFFAVFYSDFFQRTKETLKRYHWCKSERL